MHMNTPIQSLGKIQLSSSYSEKWLLFIHVSSLESRQRQDAVSRLLSAHLHIYAGLTLSMLNSEKCIPFEEPGPPANVPPCQRQRGFKTGGFGRLYHLQAIFQPIHLARIIECLCLSAPGGVTSYHKAPAPLLIKQGMGGSSRGE